VFSVGGCVAWCRYCKQMVENDEGEEVEDYHWSVIATKPNAADPEWVERKALLRSLKMYVVPFPRFS
jgi:hypothetical protein